jgi:2-keto-4-pentenoate hydratase
MDVDLRRLARQMLADYDARKPGHCTGNLTSARAYALQAEIARLREERGERVIGYKVGCTSPAVRDQLGVREPIFGRLFDTGCVAAGSRIRHADYANLAVEGELAIRLSRDMPVDPLSDDEATRAIASVFPVVELHHYVLPAGGPPVGYLIASSGMHAGVVLAEREAPCSGQVPRLTRLAVTINDELTGSTAEPWTMGGPVITLRWLSARLAEQGLRLQRGQVILAGSALPLFPVWPGSRIVVEACPLGVNCVEID